ncbi:MAG: hypothetical protein ACKOXV_06750 [Bacteroidota bacterium]
MYSKTLPTTVIKPNRTDKTPTNAMDLPTNLIKAHVPIKGSAT